MKKWAITSDAGVDMGIYEGETREDALDAMARDAGYKSQAGAEARSISPFAGQVKQVEARQDPRSNEYRKSTDNLFGRFMFFYEHCAYLICKHPPRIAVSYITEIIDGLAPHVARHEKARNALLEPGRELDASREEATNETL